MATTPRRPRYYYQNQDPTPETPSTDKRRLQGLWHAGQWWCNCSPRKRAVERNVLKDTPNKGKPFWACPVPSPEGCGFFLWFKDARLREIGLQSSVSEHVAGEELPPQSKTPILAQKRLTSCGFRPMGNRQRGDASAAASAASAVATGSSSASSSSSKTAETGTAVSSNFAPLTPGPSGASKRKRDAFEDDDNDNDNDNKFSDMSSDEERELAAITDRSVERIAQQRIFPDTVANNNNNKTSTSQQPVARTLFPRTASSKRQKTVSFEEPRSPPTPTKTLTSSRTTDSLLSLPSLPASRSTSTSSTLPDCSDITQEVMDLLRGQKVNDSVLRSVRQLLVTSARITQGIAKGRDAARTKVKDRDAKIARLKERIVALEEKERLLSSRATDVKAGLMRLYESS